MSAVEVREIYSDTHIPRQSKKMRRTATAAFLLLLCLLDSATATSPPSLNDDVLALVVLKSSLSDPGGALASWNEDDDTPCAWEHVECDPATSSTVAIFLSSLNLSGELRPRGLDRLTSLTTLSLANNNLSGELPAGIFLPPRLSSLDLSGNSFSGRIPGDLHSLISLNLSGNSLTGPLPDSLFSNSSKFRQVDLAGNLLEGPVPATLSECGLLVHLNLSSNRLSGSSDPVWGLTHLRELDLTANSFSGDVPERISLLHNLKMLRLGGNGFSGEVPAGVGLLPHLKTLDLSRNAFAGAPPETLALLTSLSFLDLSDNQISGELRTWVGNLTALSYLDLSSNQLAGEVPSEVGNLKALEFLDLSSNKLRGSIPDSLSECYNLAVLRFKRNSLDGSIPQSLFNLRLEELDLSSNNLSGELPSGGGGARQSSETLRLLDLSDNILAGEIPPEIALYYNLRYLNLSHNALTARLPPELGSFPNLSILDLREAKLFGRIPSELCDSGGLVVLQLDANNLSGGIPDEIGNCSSLNLLGLSNNSLVGPIPAAMAQLRKLKILDLEFNNLSGEIPPELGSLENLLAVNISHNRLAGPLPTAGIFPSLERSSLEGNLGICTPLVIEPCMMNVPKPLVLDPNEYNNHNVGNGGGSRVPASSSEGSLQKRRRRRRLLSVSAIIAISAALVILLGVLAITLLNVSSRRRASFFEHVLESMSSSSAAKSVSGSGGGGTVGKMVLFTPKNGLRTQDVVGGAAALLSKAIEIGRGAHGVVYRATVGDGTTVVAVKKLAGAVTTSITFYDDFDRELRALGKARHPNLMPLKGYFWTPDVQLLITDIAAGGSLESRLADLTWPERFNILVGTARGLAHLHSNFRPPIVHFAMKPTNILIDGEGTAKISDFGLSRLLQHPDKNLAGNAINLFCGYSPPEMACRSLRVNEKCDVYGFGVVALETVTGKKAVEYGDDEVVVLVDVVRSAVDRGIASECVDLTMRGCVEEEVLPVLKLGLVCTSTIPSSRPSMAEVVQILQVIKTPVTDMLTTTTAAAAARGGAF